ncbi:MAG: corrinoid protein [Planctomycetota bacterium]|jgi:5-methyltetrahydrofolate--homocysteine methyltransferase
MALLEEINSNLQAGQAPKVKELVQKAVDEGVPVADILNQGLLSGMSVIGGKFKKNEVYVPEVLIAARAMHWGMEVLQPLLEEAGVEPVGRIVIGTVKGDLHDIGKNLVGMMLRGAGFEVIDAGIDVPPEKFVETAKTNGAKVIGCSALLTTTMPQMKNVVDAVKAAGVDAKVMIGGAPVTQEYCDEIGADGYAPDAASAADLARELTGAA